MPAFSDYKTPQDYGGPLNGEIAAQCQAILNDGYNLYIPYGAYNFNWVVNVPSNRSVLGSWQRPRISTNINQGTLFDVAGSDIRIENIWGDFGGLPSGANMVRLRNDLTAMERIQLKRLISFRANGLVTDFATGYPIVSLTVEDVVGRIHRGPGFSFSKVFAYLRMLDNLVDYVGSPTSAEHNYTGYSLRNNAGAWWERCDVTGGLVDGTTGNNHGFYWDNSVANWVNNCMADTVGGGGFFLNGGNSHFYLTRCISSLNGTHPFSITGNNDISLVGCEAGGRAGLPYAPGYAGFIGFNNNGLIIDGSNRAYNNVGGASQLSGNSNSVVTPFVG